MNHSFVKTIKRIIENIWMIIAVTGLTIFLGIAILIGAKDPFKE